jgi:hypothetical protein
MASHISEMEAALASEDEPAAVLHRFIDAEIDSIAKRRDFFFIYYTYLHPQHSDHRLVDVQLDCDCQKQLMDRLREVIARGIANGELVNVDGDYIGAVLMGGIISMYYLGRMRFTEEWDVEEMKACLKKIFFGPVLIGERS